MAEGSEGAEGTTATEGKATEEGKGEGSEAPDHAAEVKRLTEALANERKRQEKAEKELADLRKLAMTEQERAVAEAKAEGKAEAIQTLARKLLEAEVRAQAAGKLADPADAARLLDLDDFLGDDGTYDAKAIGRALDELVVAKPYLAAGHTNGSGSAAKPPQGARDGGKQSEADDFIRGMVKGR